MISTIYVVKFSQMYAEMSHRKSVSNYSELQQTRRQIVAAIIKEVIFHVLITRELRWSQK